MEEEKMQDEQLYDELAERLNQCMIGAPKTKELMEILKTSYTPEEIKITPWLSFIKEDFETIVQRAELDADELRAVLERLADKGLVYRGGSEEKPTYGLLPSVIGFFQTPFWPGKDNPTAKKLARHWLDYYHTGFVDEMAGKGTPVMRVVPVEQAVADTREVTPYEIASEIIKSQNYIALAHCACKVMTRLDGQRCSYPEEVCLHFGKFGQYMVERSMAREISTEEALKVLKQTEEAGLVHSVDNMEQRTSVMCNCCPCCCVFIKGITEWKIPTALGASRYYMRPDRDNCTGCGTCVERCPVGAVTIEDEHSVVNEDKCIGCGVCTSTCPTDSAVLVMRELVPPLPKTAGELRTKILTEKGRL
jgi:NAD-dependent dihydropyrimidine dehydrogenase PreA subunit